MGRAWMAEIPTLVWLEAPRGSPTLRLGSPS